jgi:chromosome partitioning protein
MANRARVYAIANRKGGVGKTTVAVTLAAGLAAKGATVLLVDLDPQGNVAPSLGVRPRDFTVADILIGDCQPEDAIIPGSGRVERPGLYVLPANGDLADVKIELVAEAATSAVVARMGGRRRTAVAEAPAVDDLLNVRLKKAQAAFDFIVVDCPPSLDMLAHAVYRFADAAIVPVRPDFLGTAGTAQHTHDIVEAQKEGVDIRIEWFVPTFVRAREILARQMLASLVKTYGQQRVAPPIPQAVVVEQAPAAGGLTVLEHAPDSPAADAFRKLIDLVYDRR